VFPEIWPNLQPSSLWYIKINKNGHYCDDLMILHEVLLHGHKLIPTPVPLSPTVLLLARVKVRMQGTWDFTKRALLFPWILGYSFSLLGDTRPKYCDPGCDIRPSDLQDSSQMRDHWSGLEH
jgi:hypothetical protein